MSRRKFYGLVTVLSVGMLALPAFVVRSEAQNTDELGAETEYEAAAVEYDYPTIPAELDDPAFDQYVDISLLELAWTDLDAELLTDVALQLAAGEKVLMRSHRAGSAEDLLKLAASVAAKDRNKDAVARIGKAADALGYDGLKAQVASAEKIAGASRKAEPALNVPVDQATPADFADFKDMLQDIKGAEVLGDREALEEMDAALEELEGVSDERRQYLKLVIGEALETVPSGDDAQQNSMSATIKKLEGTSRDERSRRVVGDILFGVGAALGNRGSFGGDPRWGGHRWGGHRWGGHRWGGHRWGGHRWGGHRWGGHRWGGHRWGGGHRWSGHRWGGGHRRSGWGRP